MSTESKRPPMHPIGCVCAICEIVRAQRPARSVNLYGLVGQPQGLGRALAGAPAVADERAAFAAWWLETAGYPAFGQGGPYNTAQQYAWSAWQARAKL
jgi:hypothetical protein